MIELDEDEELLENADLYDAAESDGIGMDDEFAGVTRANYVDRVRFSRVP